MMTHILPTRSAYGYKFSNLNPISCQLQNYKELELLRLVYYGGVEHEIRKEVWPFLLGHYKFGMGKKDMAQVSRRATA